MTFFKHAAAAAAAMATLALPSTAQAGTDSDAEALRKLDIMLMVTGLRCRNTSDNFTPEYGRFTSAHMSELNAAAASLKKEMVARYGSARANRALDRLSVQMANQYGQGHPWLNCRQLKQVAGSLANMRGAQPLVEAADELLDDHSRQLAWVR